MISRQRTQIARCPFPLSGGELRRVKQRRQGRGNRGKSSQSDASGGKGLSIWTRTKSFSLRGASDEKNT